MVLNRLAESIHAAIARVSGGFRAGLRVVAAACALTAVAAPALAIPEITVTTKRTTLLDGGSFAFGSVREDRSFTQTLTIKNDGDTPLALTSVTIEPPFEIGLAPAATLAPGKRTTIRIVLPSGLAAGAVSGLLTIENDDPNENPFTLTLDATVLPVEPDIRVLAGAVDVPAGGSYAMGLTEAGTGIARKFTLQNTGNADLHLQNPVLTGSGFAVDFPKTRVLRPGKRLTFTARFFQSTAGNFDGTLVIPSDDPDEGDYDIELLATATPADARIRVFSQGQAVENGGDVDFGSTRSDRRIDRLFTIRNEGRSVLTIDGVSVTGPGYTLVSEPRATLARGKSTKFKVRLDPAMTGDAPMGLLSFETNSPDNELFEIDLTADVNVVAPMITVSGPNGTIASGDTLTLETTNVNQPLTTTFTIANSGTSDLTLGPVNLTGAGYTLSRAPESTVAPGRTTSFVVRLFSAVVIDPANAGVSFTTNVADLPTMSFNLAGAVRIVPPSPEIEVQEQVPTPSGGTTQVTFQPGSNRNYGTVAAGNAVNRVYTIRNRGTSPLALSGFLLTNTTGGAFTVLSGVPLPASLAPAATTTFSVQFLPIAAGNFAATISFANDDPDDGENPFTFMISGTATAASTGFDVRYTGFEGVILKRLPNPLPPIGSRPYPFSLGAVPGGGSTTMHNTGSDAFLLRNLGNSPLIVSSANIIDPVPPNPIVWLGELNPPPCFPVACPLAPLTGTVQINVTHNGLTAGPSRGLVTIISDAAALTPWEFEIQEWVQNWFATAGGLGGGNGVRSFATFDPDGTGAAPSQIYAGGSFTNPGGSPRIATFTGGSWTALTGGGINTAGGSVNALAVYDEPGDSNPALLFAGGESFTSVGAPAMTGINNIAKWNGTTWAPVGTAGTNGVQGGAINAMTVWDTSVPATDPPSQLYAAGTFTNASGVVVQGIARWNGVSWSKLLPSNDGVSGGAINALAVFDTDGNGSQPAELYAAGSFSNCTSLMTPVNGIARFNGTMWQPVGNPMNPGISGGSARINAMVVFDDDGIEGPNAPALIVGGSFVSASTTANVNSIARWTGTTWQQFAAGGIGAAPNEIFALAVFDEDAFHPDDNDGDTNNDPNSGPGDLKRHTQPGRLYAAGNFSFGLPSGNFVNNMAKWNPNLSQWQPVGDDISNGTNGVVRALHPFDADGLLTAGQPNNPEKLFVGGFFTNVIELVADPAPDVTLMVNNVAVWGSGAP